MENGKEEVENDNLNNNIDHLFDKAVDDRFVDTKKNDHEKVVVIF